MLFGTDHPFFPPLLETEKWKSVVENLDAIDGVQGWWTQDEKIKLEAEMRCLYLIFSFSTTH